MNEVALIEMLDARERRVEIQHALLKEYQKPLVCLTLNIPGPVKVFPGVKRAYEAGCEQIASLCTKHQIPLLKAVQTLEKTGLEAFFVYDAPADRLKELAVSIEDHTELGRLFDIDVIQEDGTKRSREDTGLPARTCLLCDKPAHVCSRSRSHSVSQLLVHIRRIFLKSYMNEAVYQSLVDEVAATPKPGLVDYHDSGAHNDMDYHTFLASAKAISPYISDMALAGYDWDRTLPLLALFQQIRKIGIEAEKNMYNATNEVNTHKGAIFSMGILSAAAGYYYRQYGEFQIESILKIVSTMTYDILENDFAAINREHPVTHGEKLYVKYGIKGIRGEAQKGYPEVITSSLPLLRKLMEKGADKNVAYLEVLLNLISSVDDTNILIRTSPERLSYAKKTSENLLKMKRESLVSDSEWIHMLEKTNQDFVQKNISAGGCADLLALTILCYRLEQFSNL